MHGRTSEVHRVQLMLRMQKELLRVQNICQRVQGASVSSGDGDNLRDPAKNPTGLFSLPADSKKKGFGSSATPIKFAERVRERRLCVPALCQSSVWNQTGPNGLQERPPQSRWKEGGREK